MKNINTSCIRFQDAQTRRVVKTVWLEVPQPGGQIRHVANGQTVTEYQYAASVDNAYISLNGRVYSVKDNFEWAIKIQRTQIQARSGAAGLIEFLTTHQSKVSDGWEQKIIDNCRALN